MIHGRVVNLLDQPELALGGRVRVDAPVRWSDNHKMPPVSLFVADLGRCVVTSCFIPIKTDTNELFLDQTYENVRQFHPIHPVLSANDSLFTLDKIPNRIKQGTTVLIGGSPENNWYHWILNWLPRLTLVHALHPNILDDESVRFAFHSNVETEPYRSMIDCLHIDSSRLFFFDPQEGCEFERLLVPTFGNPNFYYPQLLGSVRETFLSRKTSEVSSRVLPRMFVSRENIAVPKRRVDNKEEFYLALSDRGVVPVVLEDMTGVEQVRLFSEADLVIGVHGAGLANLIFCSRSTRAILLDNVRNISVGMAGMFSGLCRTMGLEYCVMTVDEVDLEGVDYGNFYHLHNKDVVVDVPSFLRTVEMTDKMVEPLRPGAAINLRDLNAYIRLTDELLSSVDPFVGLAPAGFEVDYLGVETALHLIAHWYPAPMMEEASLNARHRTTMRPTPAAGEPYFESGSLLRAIHEGGEVIRLIELGGGYGARACELAFHCKRVGKKSQSMVVEPVEQYLRWGLDHLKHNGVDLTRNSFVRSAVASQSRPLPMRTAYQGFGNEVVRAETLGGADEKVSVKALLSGGLLNLADGSSVEMVNALSLTDLIFHFDFIDLIDVDVQHLEHEILSPAWELINRIVRRLHIGTHTEALHESIRMDLISNQWVIEVDLPPYSETACLDGPTKINDGIIAAYNPGLRAAG